MSFVVDQVRRIDSQLDRLQLSRLSDSDRGQVVALTEEEVHDTRLTSRIHHLQQLIKSLSTSSAPTAPLLPVYRILSALDSGGLSTQCSTCQQYFEQDDDDEDANKPSDPSYEHELEWLLIGKATVQAYGQVINTILEQTIPLNNEIWYWDDILGSYRYAGLYSIQTSPIRFWGWSKKVYHDVKARGGAVTDGWKQFYGLVREVIRERSLADIQKRVVSPMAVVFSEARRNRSKLRRLRDINANALGVLLGEGLSNESIHDETISEYASDDENQGSQNKWKTTIAKTIALMEAVLQNAGDVEVTAEKFDDSIAASTQEDFYYELHEPTGERTALSLKPAHVAARLQIVLKERLNDYTVSLTARSQKSSRPSRIVRYWLPISVALVSSTTILRILVNRKEDILIWVQEFGSTAINFWENWVVDPLKRLVGTIRHDEGSEISIMSKKSLEGDRASLERMVVDFAVDESNGTAMGETQIAALREKVKEGDLTPVLKAYERDMAKPIIGVVRGNLIRALLIQIQKTKVDVEVAMSGIDSILKSQELLFGFIGLTPGVLVCIGVLRWSSGIFSSRAGTRKGNERNHLVRILRNIDRILVSATPTEFGELSYKDHGLLLCEVHLLRQTARSVLPNRIFQDLLEEIDDLVDIRAGLNRQLKVVERIRWAYSMWIA